MTRDEAMHLVQRDRRGILTLTERRYLHRVAIALLGHLIHRIDNDTLRALPAPAPEDADPPQDFKEEG